MWAMAEGADDLNLVESNPLLTRGIHSPGTRLLRLILTLVSDVQNPV